MKVKPKLLFHIECFWGIGHAVRAFRIASELCNVFECYILSGSEVFEKFRVNPNIHLIKLPTLYYKSYNDSICAKDLSLNRALEKRELLVLKAFMEIKPDVLLIEMFPFGRLSISMEIFMLAELSLQHSVPIFLTVRDIQVYHPEEKLKHKYSFIANEFISSFSPQILVHSDKKILPYSYVISDELFNVEESSIHQTGYIGRTGVYLPNSRANKMVVAFGGGRSSNEVISRFLKSLKPHIPNYDIEFWGLQEGEHSGTVSFNSERAFSPLNELGALVITGGYNSWMDVLSTRIPAIVIALDEEQYIRSKTLTAYCPWTRMVTLDDTCEAWVDAWHTVKKTDYPEHINVDVGGSGKTCSIIAKAFLS